MTRAPMTAERFATIRKMLNNDEFGVDGEEDSLIAYELFDEVNRLRAQHDAARADRWWQTYNAALTGELSSGLSVADASRLAGQAANLAHGPLDESATARPGAEPAKERDDG